MVNKKTVLFWLFKTVKKLLWKRYRGYENPIW